MDSLAEWGRRWTWRDCVDGCQMCLNEYGWRSSSADGTARAEQAFLDDDVLEIESLFILHMKRLLVFHIHLKRLLLRFDQKHSNDLANVVRHDYCTILVKARFEYPRPQRIQHVSTSLSSDEQLQISACVTQQRKLQRNGCLVVAVFMNPRTCIQAEVSVAAEYADRRRPGSKVLGLLVHSELYVALHGGLSCAF